MLKLLKAIIIFLFLMFVNPQAAAASPCVLFKERILLEGFLRREGEWLPQGVEILGLSFHEGALEINFSKEILYYGGNEMENELVSMILEIIFSVEEVENVTFYIDGKLQPLPEGWLIDRRGRGRASS